jgi:hypothetical protein
MRLRKPGQMGGSQSDGNRPATTAHPHASHPVRSGSRWTDRAQLTDPTGALQCKDMRQLRTRATAFFLAAILTLVVASPAVACLAYQGNFHATDIQAKGTPDLLVVGTAESVASVGSDGRPTAFLLDLEREVVGNATDPLWVGGEDACHYPAFELGDRLLVAYLAVPYEDPVSGVSDLSGAFWVLLSDGSIDYAKSPALNGEHHATLGALLGAFGLPDTRAQESPSPKPQESPSQKTLPVALGVVFLLLLGLVILAVRTTLRIRR